MNLRLNKGQIPPHLMKFFRSVRFKAKDRIDTPSLLVEALREDGWYYRDQIIWFKPSPMPSSVRDRTTCAHEMIYLLTKSPRYFFDATAIEEKAVNAGKPMPRTGGWAEGPGSHSPIVHQGRGGYRPSGEMVPTTRNKRSVWRIASKPFKGAHFACYPPKLVEPCVRAGSSERGVCPACGNPWARVLSKVRTATRPGFDTKVNGEPKKLPAEEPGRASGAARFEKSTLGQVVGNRDPQRHVTTTETVGWKPGCECGLDPIPAVVADPFAGSGTTLQVAVSEGRRAIGCELNPRYHALIAKRMQAVTPSLLGVV